MSKKEDKNEHRLTAHFTLEELTRTSAKDKDGNPIDNTPAPEIVRNLRWLAENYLEYIREKTGQPVIINSGYRSPEVNKAVGGAQASMHLQGLAVDINCGGSVPLAANIIKCIEDRYLSDSQYGYHELDLCVRPKTRSLWIHLSVNKVTWRNYLNCKILIYK